MPTRIPILELCIMSSALNPRKSPRQSRAQATCDTIVEAAAQVLAVHGLAGFNTNAIAGRAGVSIGSLYQYYPNKDAVMVALIYRGIKHQLTAVKAAVAALEEAELPTMIRAIVRAAMQHHHDHPLLASAIDHEEMRLPIQNELNAYLQQAGQLVVQALLKARASALQSINPDHAARTLPALVRATVDSWANLIPPQLDRAEDEAVRAVMGYLTWDQK
jgi:AcrR family transcriptional regulator